MTTGTICTIPTYDPNALLNWFAAKLDLKNDARIAEALDVLPPTISKIRHRKIPLGDSILLKMHDMTDMRVRDLRKKMGIES